MNGPDAEGLWEAMQSDFRYMYVHMSYGFSRYFYTLSM